MTNKNGTRYIDRETVLFIRHLRSKGWGYGKIAKRAAVSWDVARDAASGRRWKGVQ